MARARNIKPGFFRNAELVELPIETRLLFPGLWILADREGRLEDRPKQIKMEIFPADSFDVDAMLDQLKSSGLILRYQVNGDRYIQVVNFAKHQNPHHMEVPSVIPPPEGSKNTYNHTPISPKQRARIYQRDGHQCLICGSTDNLQIDHIQLVSMGGDSSDDNLRTLCSQCNNKRSKTGKSEANRADSLIPDSLNLIPESKQAPDKPARFNPSPVLAELGVDPTVSADWLKLRKQKRAPVTQTAIDGIKREAAKAGLSMNDALAICCSRGWQGFEASWLSGNSARGSPAQSRDEARREVVDVLTGRGNSSGRERVITGEVIGITRAVGG